MIAAARASSSRPVRKADRQRDEACDYLDLARACLEPRPPCLIAIGGLSVTGKSTVARLLAPQLDAVPGTLRFQSDVVRKRLFGVDSESRLPDSAYSPSASRRTYAALRDGARSALAASATDVVDAVHARPEERREIEAVATGAGASFAGFWLDAPRQTLRDRIALGEISWRRFDSRREAATLAERVRETAIDTACL